MAKINDPISSISHMISAIISIPLTFILVNFGIKNTNLAGTIGLFIFGLSLFLLYSASTVYHLIPTTEQYKELKLKARRIDHMMIYVLIAGSYTPICIISLGDTIGYKIIIIIWAIAIFGVLFKMFVLNENKIVRFVSTGLYLAMGWFIVFAFSSLVDALSFTSLLFLTLGGLSYTIGAVIYALKKPSIPVDFISFHDIFHIFVILGSFFHVLTMFTLV